MGLKHVALAVIADAQAHGYEIHARVAQVLPTARQCSSSRIYAVLAGLERGGWVRALKEDAGRGRTRKLYRLTPEGSRELLRWLSHPRPGGGLLRRSLLIRLALGANVSSATEPPTARGGWREALGRRTRRREALLWAPADEGRMARLLRLRELVHLDAELGVLRGLGGPQATRVNFAPRPSSPRRVRSSASR